MLRPVDQSAREADPVILMYTGGTTGLPKGVLLSQRAGGENVYSAEVENAFSGHPAVLQVAVIGVPNEQWGEAVHAVVVLREGVTVTEIELIAHARTRIAGYKVPKSVSFRSEPLPLSGAMKVLKRELRAPFWADHNRQLG